MNAEDTYVEVVVHLGSYGVVVWGVVIPKRHQYLLTLSPLVGQKVQAEIVRIPWIYLRLVR